MSRSESWCACALRTSTPASDLAMLSKSSTSAVWNAASSAAGSRTSSLAPVDDVARTSHRHHALVIATGALHGASTSTVRPMPPMASRNVVVHQSRGLWTATFCATLNTSSQKNVSSSSRPRTASTRPRNSHRRAWLTKTVARAASLPPPSSAAASSAAEEDPVRGLTTDSHTSAVVSPASSASLPATKRLRKTAETPSEGKAPAGCVPPGIAPRCSPA
mmetsp:Transcript_3116/g.10927  ORF Transcript_3116/g.10927 Transcript_3116/m.10927 type:complete len:219 (-) Transcript_3116:552-1208(-)